MWLKERWLAICVNHAPHHSVKTVVNNSAATCAKVAHDPSAKSGFSSRWQATQDRNALPSNVGLAGVRQHTGQLMC